MFLGVPFNLCMKNMHACNNALQPLFEDVLSVQGEEEKIKKLLSTSDRVLANVVDENRRRCGTLSTRST